MQKAKKTVTAAKAGPTGSSRQALGDLHLKLAVEYERALRAVWFLNLRDKPGTTLDAFQGEDGKLTDPDGTVTFRQVKKRDVASAWRLSVDDFKRLVQNALNEVAAGDHVVFEFYTNGWILPDLVEITDRGTVLRAGHPDIAAMLAGRDPRLCLRVVFFEHHGHTDPRHLEGQIRWALEDMVRADNPTALALAIVNVEEIAILAQKLLAAEPLLINQGKVTWQDVDAMIGYQSYLATVRACLLGGQALLPIADLDALDAQLAEDAGEVLKAIREGRSIPRERIEAEILQDLQSWFAAPTRAPIRGALVLGAHGSGRTHLLMRLLAQLTKEPGLQLHIASSIDPDPNVVVPALGIERKHPLVLLIDDASEEWISILSAPSGYFSRVYFVATSASPKMAPNLGIPCKAARLRPPPAGTASVPIRRGGHRAGPGPAPGFTLRHGTGGGHADQHPGCGGDPSE